MANASISGIISGLDTESIISQLTSLRRAPQVRMQSQKTNLQKKLEAWDGLKGQLSVLKGAAAELGQAATFRRSSGTSSDTSLLTVAASPEAAPGSYNITVMATAQSHQLKSQGYADATSPALGTGTLSVQVGAGASALLTVDSTNNTLAGLRDAINREGIGVTASIINDGDAAAPYRLVITANSTGESNEITVASDLSGGTEPAFTTLQAARDASVKLGDGAGAVLVSKSTNLISDLIPGVSLNLVAADEGKPIYVSVTRDTAGIQKAVEQFVSAYNALLDSVNAQGKYNQETNQGGVLLGDASLMLIQDDIQRVLDQVVPGVPSTMSTVSQAGLTVGSDGKLNLDSARLSTALTENPSAVTKLFATYGDSADSGVKHISSTSDTKASGAGGYSVNVTRLATRSRVTAGAAQSEVLVADETVTINGTAITLAAGMTQAEVVAAINAKTTTTGVTARATGAGGTGSGNYLTLESSQHGSAYTITARSTVSNGATAPLADRSGLGNVEVTADSAAGEAGTGSGARGVDVAGTINGEAATGSGQMLVGASGNSTTAGLILQITASVTGEHGPLVFTRGVGGELERLIQEFTEGKESPLERARQDVQGQMDDLTAQMKVADDRLATLQERLREQFTAMESTLGRLQSQSSQLTAQISSLSGTASSTKK